MKRLFFILLSLAVVCGCSDKTDYDPADKIYEVGDVYFRKGKSGIVFSVTDGGRHGKIVSGNYGYCTWSQINIESGEVGTFDENDGMNNMAKIREIQGWHEKFPAFAWCADKGKDWYLPARNELRTLLESRVLSDMSMEFWSSTLGDYGEFPVKTVAVYYFDSVIDSYAMSYTGRYVRAVAAF